MSKINNKGFTLLELIIVIALIGVFGTLVVSLIDPAGQFRRGRDAERKSELRQIQTALELYRADQGAYPLTATLPTCGSEFSVDQTVYLQKIPCDPKSSGQFVYRYSSSDGLTYFLVTCLENITDPQKDAVNKPNLSGGLYCDGSDGWSYTLINP